MELISIAKRMSEALAPLTFGPPVTHVYNPLEYAMDAHSKYLRKYGRKSCEVMLLGMNPGPWGMAQTGVPFGEVNLARDWLCVEAPVGRPKHEHPKRKIEGFACARSEVSGARLWGWVRERFEEPSRFAKRFFIGNYCPLVFMEDSGRNRTPDKLPKAEKERLFEVCDEALRETARWLQPELVIGVGAFAQKRAQLALHGMDFRIGTILHPSPASPAANRGWAPAAEKQLDALGVRIP